MCVQSVFCFTVPQGHFRLGPEAEWQRAGLEAEGEALLRGHCLRLPMLDGRHSHRVTSAWDRKRSGSEQGWKQREKPFCADTVCVCQCLMAAMCVQSVFCFTVPQCHFRLGPEAEWQRAGLEAEGAALLRGHCLRLPVLDGRHVCAVRLLFHSPTGSLPPGTGSGVASGRAGSRGRSPAARTLFAFASA
ncbi:hypothetical protein NDU88_007636 [Pleurodeles waltl]|uniref:Uncharacterized protein n=1 Tax=Pleurodeles waltl TaxID=8319 RepID=A0AAV7WE52_PLEWA|nr:hypothetical protein NDU88_007636 [Pleurodeles waltl]